MWTYHQESGKMLGPAGTLLAIGYAGKGEHKNKPNSQELHNLGPLPRGFYKIGKPYDSAKVGRFAIPLDPFPENEMFGRADFRIHGDSIVHPGIASEGCICIPLWARQRIHESPDDILEVKA